MIGNDEVAASVLIPCGWIVDNQPLKVKYQLLPLIPWI